jgi:hypothetical protein
MLAPMATQGSVRTFPALLTIPLKWVPKFIASTWTPWEALLWVQEATRQWTGPPRDQVK